MLTLLTDHLAVWRLSSFFRSLSSPALVLLSTFGPINPSFDPLQVAAREAISLLPSTATLAGIIILLDRQEIGNDSTTRQSTVQEIEKEFSVPVVPIVGMKDIILWMEKKGGMEDRLKAMRAYRAQWGADV